ncbi:MAG: ATP-binding cassette domain-containing protein [Pseudomonadota bacterium]|nr:ATP-binding cassette domain-containing protein [Pseudomonadota bacterium]
MATTGHTVAAMSGLRVAVTAKQFGTAPVLADIAFELAAGERAALIGPSGIGKTTLLSLIAGLDSAFGGQITRPPGALAMVFQTPRLLPWRTLAQNITLAHPACTPGRARALLDAVGLAAAADLHPEKASLGMQRRAAMARALAVAPSLILMDEPLVSLDAASSARVQAVMVDVLDRSGATCFDRHP